MGNQPQLVDQVVLHQRADEPALASPKHDRVDQFGETRDQRPVRLVETRTVDDLAYLTYEVVREAA